ncbi:MAG: hypothetical protein IT303_11095 [Dehalococcoidia bacterium]|nr:hypothetical protein [Dehalococcoidia bacterium]
MTTRWAAALPATVLALLFAICASDDDTTTPASTATASQTVTASPELPSPTPTPTATATPTPTEPAKPTPAPATPLPDGPFYAAYPPGTRTGLSALDAIIAAVESGDDAALRDLVRIASLPCQEPRPVQPQPLRCPDGTAPGTPITGFWVIDVEGGMWPDTPDLTRMLSGLVAGQELYAAYEIDPAAVHPPDQGGGSTVILFRQVVTPVGEGTDGSSFHRLTGIFVHEGVATSWQTNLWHPPQQPLPYDFARWILPPPPP